MPQDENKIDDLTVSMERAKAKGDYEKVIQLSEKIASIYHSKGKESDAGKLEHEAFLYTQRRIYRDAHIYIYMFTSIPYVKKLKIAMTEMAVQAREQKMIEYYV